MSAETSQLEAKLDDFRVEVTKRFGDVHADLKDLTKALRELIRIDGDIRRMFDTIERIGRQVDDHELRMRVIEQRGASANERVKNLDRVQMLGVTLISSTIAGSLVFFFTR